MTKIYLRRGFNGGQYWAEAYEYSSDGKEKCVIGTDGKPVMPMASTRPAVDQYLMTALNNRYGEGEYEVYEPMPHATQ